MRSVPERIAPRSSYRIRWMQLLRLATDKQANFVSPLCWVLKDQIMNCLANRVNQGVSEPKIRFKFILRSPSMVVLACSCIAKSFKCIKTILHVIINIIKSTIASAYVTRKQLFSNKNKLVNHCTRVLNATVKWHGLSFIMDVLYRYKSLELVIHPQHESPVKSETDFQPLSNRLSKKTTSVVK